VYPGTNLSIAFAFRIMFKADAIDPVTIPKDDLTKKYRIYMQKKQSHQIFC